MSGDEQDGWSLDDGEMLHRDHPSTFAIPDLAVREALAPGDFAKLIFRIPMDGDEVAVERMWVQVTARTAGGYLGTLDNKPSLIEENPWLWLGTAVAFESRHIIACRRGDAGDRTPIG